MRLDSPLDDVFQNRSHVRVLRALHHLPEGLAVSGRDVARRAGLTHPTALKALGVLADTGLVAVGRSPAGDIYELNRDHILADKIADLYRLDSLLERELTSFLRDELLSLTNKVESVTLFGSAVWGGSLPTSDIDLAVSCEAQNVQEVEEALERLSDTVHRRFGNRLSPLIHTRRQRTRTGIWRRIETEGVPLIRSSKGVRS